MKLKIVPSKKNGRVSHRKCRLESVECRLKVSSVARKVSSVAMGVFIWFRMKRFYFFQTEISSSSFALKAY